MFTVNFQLSGVHSNRQSKIYKLCKTPMFEFGLTMREIPPEILREANVQAKVLA